jgi:hypothetical protein
LASDGHKEEAELISDSTNITLRGPIVGRALYIGKQGELYIARKYHIFRSDDGGGTWRLDCFVPPAGVKPLLARSRLAARLLRYNIAAFEVLADGTRIAVARDGVYRAAPGETRMSRVFHLQRGSRPLNLAIDGQRVLFGEYGNLLAEEVLLYISQDAGRTFEVGFRFPRGDIRHVHNIQVDPYQGNYWVLVGDSGPHPGIARLSKDLHTLDWLARGSQKCRSVAVLIEPDGLTYGTDSDCERNYIVRIDKQSGQIECLREIEGSSLYATRFGPLQVISTAVEPNPACPSRNSFLYVSRNGADWTPVCSYAKDRFHTKYFQMGTIVLPYSYNSEPRGMFSGQALQGLDDRVAFLDARSPATTATASDPSHSRPEGSGQ